MSKIDKLSVMGIRSFGPSSPETIQFNTPLTLIVGYNGSGKTTIIECLKYATTGELPPNSKGGAFIHDPELAQSKEVLAQVKLSFKTGSGAKYVVNRNLQLTVKKTTRSMKTLEGSLLVAHNGDRTVVSTRVAQLDEAIPSYLGVSPAVLDAVIFCHQDESLWPLSEPAALKKRFDEIFEAQKYTKAIDNLKTLRKKKGEDLRVLKTQEDHDKLNKERGERTEKESRELQRLIEEDRVKCQQLTEEVRETQRRAKEFRTQAASLLTVVYDIDKRRGEIKFHEQKNAELKASMQELPDTTDELRQALANYEARVADFSRQEREITEHYTNLQSDLTDARATHTRQLTIQGQRQADKIRYENKLAARSELIQAAACEQNFIGFNADGALLSDHQVASFRERIQRFYADKKRDLEQVKVVVTADIEKARTAISELEQKRASLEHGKRSAKQQIDRADRQTMDLNNRLRNIDVDESSLVMLNEQLQNAEKRLEAIKTNFSSADYDGRIRKEKETYMKLSAENKQLGAELAESSRLAQDRAQLNFRKEELNAKRRTLASLTITWQDKLAVTLGTDWTPQNLDDKFQAAVVKQETKYEEVKLLRERVAAQQTKLDIKTKSICGNLASATTVAEAAEKKVTEYLRSINDQSTGAEDFDDELSHYEEKVEDCKAEIGLWDALAKYYGQCNRYLASKNGCKLCERAFDDSQVATRARMQKKISDKLNPKDKEECENELQEATDILEKLKELRTDYETWKRLQGEIPPLKSQLAMLETEMEVLASQVMDVEATVLEEEENLRNIKGFSKTVGTFAQTLREIAEAEKQVMRIENQSDTLVTTRTTEEINEARADCEALMAIVKVKEEELVAEKMRSRDQMSAGEMEVRDVQAKTMEVKGLLSRKEELQKELAGLKDDVDAHREAITKAEVELYGIEEQLEQAVNLRDDIVREGKAKERIATEEVEVVLRTINELKPVEDEIRSYEQGGSASQLAECQKTISDLEARMAATEVELVEYTRKGNTIREEKMNFDNVKRNISDNINYRDNLQVLETLHEEIVELESRGGTEDHEALEVEALALESHASKLIAERGAVMGTMKTRDETLRKHLETWALEYKDAAQRYRESHIKVETTKAAIEDLGRYGDALDKAIMQYHAMKMRQVNETAIDLWKSTYKGDDIDYIMIRSDAESATGRRSYNYRVVMSKQGTQMDMRGRCSAGQKVLASIIIRLALAESFGVNCGIIALDEPTTNLDTDNIKALAVSLHELIHNRQAQSNFQLIIITHDEEFLRNMQCGDFCDVFYRVKRDDRARSVIMRESITNVM